MEERIRFDEAHPFLRFARRLVLSGKSSYPMNAPCDARLFYCLRGEGAITLGEGTRLPMRKGTLLLLPAGHPYRLEASTDEQVYLAVNFDYTRHMSHIKTPIYPVPAEEFFPGDRLAPVRIEDEEALNGALYLEGMHRLEGMLLRLLSVFSRKVIHYEGEVSALLFEVILECTRAHRLTPTARSRESFHRVLDYLHEHFGEPLTNADVAAALGYHKNYVRDLVKRATGLSLHRYLGAIRIERAIELLSEGGHAIGEIAEICGYCDIYHFSRAFKEATGVAPTHYRSLGG